MTSHLFEISGNIGTIVIYAVGNFIQGQVAAQVLLNVAFDLRKGLFLYIKGFTLGQLIDSFGKAAEIGHQFRPAFELIEVIKAV